MPFACAHRARRPIDFFWPRMTKPSEGFGPASERRRMLMDHGLPLVWNVVGCCPFWRPFCNVLSQVGNQVLRPGLLATRSEHTGSRPAQRPPSPSTCWVCKRPCWGRRMRLSIRQSPVFVGQSSFHARSWMSSNRR